METKYKKIYQITTNMMDCHDCLKMSTLLDIAQEVAGDHADELGCGFEVMIKHNLIWVIVRNYVEILKKPVNFKEIEVVTYPLKPRFVEFNRETEFYHNGELFAVSRSTWMVINTKDFNIESPNFFKEYTDDLGYFKRRIKKLALKDKNILKKAKDVEVLYSMLDHNGHMNNTRYVDFYLDVFKPEFSVKTLQIEYIKQSFLDDKLTLFIKDDEEKKNMSGYKDNELKFYMECEEFKE